MPDRVQIEEEEDGGGLDAGLLRGWASFAVRALRKHMWAVLTGLGLGLAGAAVLTWALPDYYLVEAHLVAQRPDVIASFGNPRRPRTSERGEISYAAHDLVKRRESLLALIGQTGLVEHWRANRSPAGRIRDRLTFRPELTDEELTAKLVDILDNRLLAFSDSRSVRVLVTWNDPEMAYRLVDGALQNYIETRHVTAMAMLGESVSLLKERLVAAEKLLDEALVAARKARPAPRRRVRQVEPEPERSLVPTQTTMELLRIRAEVASRSRTLEDLIAFRERRVAELLAELDEKRAVYGDSHPTIVTLEGSLAALSQDSPQVLTLRRELEELESRYVARGGTLADLESLDYEIATSPTHATTPSIIAALEGPLKDPSEEYARSQLTAAMVRYNTLVDRLEAVQIERDAMTAGNKYRYLVVRPPTRPDYPVNRNKKRIVWVAGALAGLVLGGLAAFGLAYREGRIVQAWQVELGLGLPILAELSPLEGSPERS